jgi:hypothetical protein
MLRGLWHNQGNAASKTETPVFRASGEHQEVEQSAERPAVGQGGGAAIGRAVSKSIAWHRSAG